MIPEVTVHEDGIGEWLLHPEKPGLALDIDETLCATDLHWFNHLSATYGNPEGLTRDEVRRKYRRLQNYWQSPEALAWMRDAVNSDALQEILPMIANAHHTVEQISEIIPIVVYMTARPRGVMRGTKKWLETHGFPDIPLLMRPHETDHPGGNRWKAYVLSSLYPRVTGIIDDNPAVVDYLPEGYPGVVFLYDNVGHVRKDIRVIPCPTWEEVLGAVKEYRF